jgi:putative ATPase
MARSVDDTDSLFGEEPALPPTHPLASDAPRRTSQPLAARMRPRSLAEIVGQEHILKEGNLLPRLIATNRFGSLLFYGPPGCGKTSLAEVIARETKSRFVRINAVMSNVAELR